MKQPKMKRLSDGQIFTVNALHRLDKGTTLRAFPMSTEPSTAMSYVIIQGEGEDTEVNAELIYS